MHIRSATLADKVIVLNLIKKLAQYEKKDCQITLEKIEQDIFKNQKAFILLAERGTEVIGYALYFFTYAAVLGAPILYLEDLFVEENHRNVGIGKAFMSELSRIALEHHCCRMEWHTFNWNESAINFYNSFQAKPSVESLPFSLSSEELVNLANFLSTA